MDELEHGLFNLGGGTLFDADEDIFIDTNNVMEGGKYINPLDKAEEKEKEIDKNKEWLYTKGPEELARLIKERDFLNRVINRLSIDLVRVGVNYNRNYERAHELILPYQPYLKASKKMHFEKLGEEAVARAYGEDIRREMVPNNFIPIRHPSIEEELERNSPRRDFENESYDTGRRAHTGQSEASSKSKKSVISIKNPFKSKKKSKTIRDIEREEEEEYEQLKSDLNSSLIREQDLLLKIGNLTNGLNLATKELNREKKKYDELHSYATMKGNVPSEFPSQVIPQSELKKSKSKYKLPKILSIDTSKKKEEKKEVLEAKGYVTSIEELKYRKKDSKGII